MSTAIVTAPGSARRRGIRPPGLAARAVFCVQLELLGWQVAIADAQKANVPLACKELTIRPLFIERLVREDGRLTAGLFQPSLRSTTSNASPDHPGPRPG